MSAWQRFAGVDRLVRYCGYRLASTPSEPYTHTAMHDDTTKRLASQAVGRKEIRAGFDGSRVASAKSVLNATEVATLAHQLRVAFGWNLRQVRADENLTRDKVATTSGLPEHCVRQIEAGLIDPTLRDMTALALAVGRDLWTLLTLPDT